MKTRCTTSWICAAWIIAGLAASTVHGVQSRELTPAPSGPDRKAQEPPLSERQALVRDRVTRLEDRMFQLHEALRKNEPENAQKLLGALGTSRSLMVRQKVEAIITALNDGQYADAHDQQEAVATDLQALLKLLLEEPDHAAERLNEMERLRVAHESLERVIKDQQRELEQAQAATMAETQNAQLEAARRALQELAERQSELRTQTQEQAAAPEAAAAKQRQLADEAATQAARLHDIPRATESPATAAAKAAQSAVDEMRDAASKLDKSESDSATQAQEKAEAALKEAIEQIEKQIAENKAAPSARDQAADQAKTADETSQLGEEMKSSDSPSAADKNRKPDGNSPKGGDESKPKGESPKDGKSPENSESPSDDQATPSDESQQDLGDNKPLPGQQEVENAVPLQREAADQLKKDQPEEAAKKQAEALKKLKQAKEQLEDTLEQLRKEQQEMLLAALETRFAAMLAKQIECSKATGALHQLGRANWKRTDQLALADLAGSQQWISQEADKALTILKEEGTTVAFPQIVQQVRDDSVDAGEHIAAADVAEITQTIQRGIEEALRELLDAVKKKQEELQSAPDEAEGGQSADQNPPLLPGSAELKLLRSCQLRINTATSLLDSMRAADPAAQKLADEVKRLSQRQQQVSDMARQMHESLTRPQ